MSIKIIQIIPSDTKAIWFNPSFPDYVEVDKVACLALVEKGTSREVVYMEVKDSLIDIIDIEDPTFIGFADSDLQVGHLRDTAKERFKKGNQ